MIQFQKQRKSEDLQCFYLPLTELNRIEGAEEADGDSLNDSRSFLVSYHGV